MTTWYDAIIIGTGQAGPSLAVRLAGARMKVAIIERKRFGGTCVNCQHRLHPDEDAGRKRSCSAYRAAGGRVWRDDRKLDCCQHEESQRAQGRCRAALE